MARRVDASADLNVDDLLSRLGSSLYVEGSRDAAGVHGSVMRHGDAVAEDDADAENDAGFANGAARESVTSCRAEAAALAEDVEFIVNTHGFYDDIQRKLLMQQSIVRGILQHSLERVASESGGGGGAPP
uniref:Uncharacterized protein n=1 Tax=Phaeomonas parva TaxID=124430 RepID=A0A7S1TSE4_9STRA|mmetsp:Transcript_14998/g.45300  ORF Transcript_14998/g.45300 Transcript_14998/m.45300 type:complete len:130 (+) Transcript_14998:10-399(+)